MSANKPVFSKLVYYSFALLVCGLGAFWAVARTPLLRVFGLALSRGTLDAAGAAAGVLATNAVIAAYVLSAWAEEQEALAVKSVSDASAREASAPASAAGSAAPAAATGVRRRPRAAE